MVTLLALALPARAWDNYRLVSELNGWNNSDGKNSFTSDGNTRTLKLDKFSGHFRIGSYYANDNQKQWGPKSDGTAILNGQTINSDIIETTGNAFKVGDGTSEYTNVTITFDNSNNSPANIKVTYTEPTTFYYALHGNVISNDWQPTLLTDEDNDGWYEVKATFHKGNFGIRVLKSITDKLDDQEKWIGGSQNITEANKAYTMSGSGDSYIALEGEYTFCYNPSSNEVKLIGETVIIPEPDPVPTWKYYGMTPESTSTSDFKEVAGTWNATDKTMTYVVTLNNGDKFLFRDGSNYVSAPSGKGTVVNNDERTLQSDSKEDFKWDGGNGEVTIVVTFNADGNPVKAKVNGPEKPVVTPDPVVSTWKVIVAGKEYPATQIGTLGTTVTYYVSNVIDVKYNDEITFTDGEKTYYRRDNSNWALTLDHTSDNKYGKMSDQTIQGNSVNGLVWNTDNATVKIYFTAYSDNRSIIDEVYVEEAQLTFAPGYPRVYLLGDLLNNFKVTPEYEMEKSLDGTFVIKEFALRNANARGTSNNPELNNGFRVRVFYNADAYRDVKYTDDAHVKIFNWNLANDDNPGYPGWGAKAVFTLNENDLDASTLSFSSSSEKRTELTNNVLPYVGILGKNFIQETEYETTETHTNGNTELMGHTGDGWQEAYIQYGPNGRPVIEKGKALYNTMWPPKNNILMQSKRGNYQPLGVSTRTMRFFGDEERNGLYITKTGAAWKADLTAKDAEAYEGLTKTRNINNTNYAGLSDNVKYMRFVCKNLWINGEFKIWTGWGGQPVKSGGWSGQWNNHLYFSKPKHENYDNNNGLKEGVSYLASANVNDVDYVVNTPTFFSTVELFIPVDQNGNLVRNNMTDARLYLTKSPINAQINASNANVANNKEGYYSPSIELPAGYKVTSYKVVRADFNVNPNSSNKEDWQPISTDGKWVSEAQAIVKQANDVSLDQSAFDAQFAADITSAANVKWTKDAVLAEGVYFYYLDITVNDGIEDKNYVVPSPYIAIIETSAETSVRPYQLVQVEAGSNKYVTYRPGTVTQYDVTLDENDNIVGTPAKRAMPFNYADGLWTAKVAVATTVPSAYARSAAQSKKVTDFHILYNGVEISDNFAEQATANPNGTFYTVTEYNDLKNFSGNYTASFTAEVKASATGNAEIMSDDDPEPNTLALTMPVYSVDEVAFIVNEGITNGDTDHVVKVNDAKAASHLHEVSDALLNSLDVKISVKNPNVVPELRTALNGQFNDVLTVGDKTYNVTYDAATADKSVTLVDEDPNNWLNAADWAPVAKSVSLKGAGANRFSNADLLAYTAGNASVEAKLVATPLQLPKVKIPALRTKVKKDANVNMLWERIYIKKTAMPLGSTTRSMLANVTLNNNGTEELVLLKVGDETRLNNYVTVEDEMEKTKVDNGGKCYHRFGELEDEGNLVLLKESEISSTWYAGIYNDKWIGSDKLPTVTFGVANIFSGNTNAVGYGITVAARSAAPALAAADAPTHYVLYPPMSEGNVEFDIQTAVDSIEADQAWIEAGNGFFTINADGVTVYDVNGIKVADAQGRYDVNAGVYLALKAGKAIKIYVK